MPRVRVLFAVLAVLALPLAGCQTESVVSRSCDAAEVMRQFSLGGHPIPSAELASAKGVAIVKETEGGVIVGGRVVTGRNGFGGELGHVLIPYQEIPGIEGLVPGCNCGRMGDLESLCSLTAIRRSLLPHFLARHPGHPLAAAEIGEAAKQVRGLAERGDAMCREIFRVQARALGLFFDEMINVFDPDALFVGGGAVETGAEFRHWFLAEIRAGMPSQREEQAGLPLHVISDGDSAGARGAAIDAARLVRERGL